MKSINKYIAMGLVLNFISCDLLMNDEIKEKSLGLFNKVHSVLDAKVDAVKDKKSTKKKKKVIKVKRPSAVASQKTIVNGNDVVVVTAQQNVQNDAILNKEATRVALSGTNLGLQNTNRVQEQNNAISKDVQILNTKVATTIFDNNSRVSVPVGKSVIVEPKKDDNIIVQSNLINFDIDFNSNQSQIISGSNLEEIEEDEDYYYFQEGEVIEDEGIEYEEEDKELLKEARKLSNRYNSYLENVRHNVSAAISKVNEIYNNSEFFAVQRAKMYSTYLDTFAKNKAKEEARKFTKEKLERDLNTLLNYIQVSARTATNFVHINDKKAKTILDRLEIKVETLIADVKKQSDSYQAYKTILLLKSHILEMINSLNTVQVYVYR